MRVELLTLNASERPLSAGFEFGLGTAEGLEGLFRAMTDDPTGNRAKITAG